MRYPGRTHPARRRRIPRPRPGRRDRRDRRRDAAAPSGLHPARQEREQRLGRLSGLLGAHHAGNAGRRAGSAGRHGRAGGAQAQRAARRPLRQHRADQRRLHGLSVQRHVAPGLAGAAQHPQRLQHAGAARRRFAAFSGARPDDAPVDLPQCETERDAAPDPAGRLDHLPHQPGDLDVGRPARRRHDRGLPLSHQLRLHARRNQLDGRPAVARGDRPREPATHQDRRQPVHGAVLAPSRLGDPPAGGRARRRLPRPDRHRERTGAAHRNPRRISPRHQRRPARGPAGVGSLRLQPRPRSTPIRRRNLGPGRARRQPCADRGRRSARHRLVQGAWLPSARGGPARLVSLPVPETAGHAFRDALPGTPQAARRTARQPVAGGRDRLVGETTRRI